MRTRGVVWAVASVLLGTAAMGLAQPVPGDVFREYMWWNEKGDAGGSLRVGGQYGEKQERFTVTGDLGKAVAAQLVWSSWSPGYMRGISINGTQVFDAEGPRYQYYFHRANIDNLSAFKPGVNTLTTGKTPLINGQMVHGMEVNWPGIMVLIQYYHPAGNNRISTTP